MHQIQQSSLARFWVAALILLALVPGSTGANAQSPEATYSHPTYGFTVSWSDDWILDDVYEDESYIFLTRGEEFDLGIFAFDSSEITPSQAVEPFPDEVVVDDQSGNEPPRVIFDEDGYYIVIEAYSINNGDVTVTVSLSTPPELVDDAIAFVQNEVFIDDHPLLAGMPIDGSGEELLAQSDGTSDSEGLTSYSGPVYGYTVGYDPALWTLDTEINEGNVDGVRLLGENSTFTIWAWDAYGSDPVACLNGEIAYYSTEVDAITGWQSATGADGEPLRYESDNLAWGVFNLTFTDEQGNSYPSTDYISCEPIPGQDAVLIVLLSTQPDEYNSELERALDVLDTLAFDGAADPATPDSTGTTGGTDTGQSVGEEISINLDGTEYSSPNYGFTAMIPLEWQILEESVDGTDELLMLGNGTSVVTLWATQDYSGDLAGCIDFAAANSGLNLELDSDASGGEFRGAYRNEAFGNFVYDEDGEQMMYFINCQTIPGTNGHLILIQDVPYDQFTAERQSRIEIENGITMP